MADPNYDPGSGINYTAVTLRIGITCRASNLLINPWIQYVYVLVLRKQTRERANALTVRQNNNHFICKFLTIKIFQFLKNPLFFAIYFL